MNRSFRCLILRTGRVVIPFTELGKTGGEKKVWGKKVFCF